MTYEYKEVQTCVEHGFALSPDGTCVRCRSVAARAERRSALVRVVTCGVRGVFATALLGGTLAFARARSSSEVSSSAPQRQVAPGPAIAPEAALNGMMTEWGATKEDRPRRVTSPATHAALRAWERELARADGKRFAEEKAEAMANAEAERVRAGEPAAAAVAPAAPRDVAARPTPRTAQVSAPPPQVETAEDHPSWWRDPKIHRRPCGRVTPRQIFADDAPRADGVWTPTNSNP